MKKIVKTVFCLSLISLSCKSLANQYGYMSSMNWNGKIYSVNVINEHDGKSEHLIINDTKLELDGFFQAGHIAIDKVNGYLYVASEYNGDLRSFKINKDGSLSKIGSISTASGQVHLTITEDGKYLLLSGYTNGDLWVVNVNPKGEFISSKAYFQNNDGEKSQSHMIAVAPDKKSVFSTGFYENRIYQWTLTSDGQLIPNKIAPYVKIDKNGKSPRHFAFSDDSQYLILVNQDSNTLETFRFNKENGALDKVIDSSISTIPANEKYEISHAGNVVVKGDFIYVSNRPKKTILGNVENVEGNISIFKLDSKTGRLVYIGYSMTHGFNPSTLSINGGFLYVPHMGSGNLSQFKINPNGTLDFINSMSNTDDDKSELIATGEIEFNYPNYIEGGNYNAGDIVKGLDGNLYKCKPYPQSEWCSVKSARYYEPGKGLDWRNAWIKLK